MSKSASEITPPQLAEALGISPPKAEGLLSHLNIRDDITSDITEDGQIAYSIRNQTGPTAKSTLVIPETERMRVLEYEQNPGQVAVDSNDAQASESKTQLSSVAKT
jgi:hypothetical protein